jgi:hypothetical protein
LEIFMTFRGAVLVFLLILFSFFGDPVFGQMAIHDVDNDQVGTGTTEFELKTIGGPTVNLDMDSADLAITNVGSPDPVNAGDTITYTRT